MSQVAIRQDGGSPTWVRDLLATAAGPRARRAARYATAGLAAWEVGRKAWTWSRERIAYTVTVPAEDDIYDAVHDWMVEHVPANRRRSVAVSTRSLTHDSTPEDGRPPEPRRVRLHYDGSREQPVIVDGHRVHVKVERSARAEGFSLSVNSGTDWTRTLYQIVFTCHGAAARDAVLGFLAGLADERQAEQRTPRMWTAARWGGWTRVQDAPQRNLSTVILADGMLDRIVADLGTFIASEARYNAVGIPWHRGYLFHGPPGTGKTSAAKALAAHYGLDVYFLSLSDLEADTNLLSMLADVSARSMLVMEDIDVVHAATHRTDESRRVSLSGLLNALDGFTTPHGLVTMMTTNNLAALDPALRRAGRADVLAEFGLLDDDQARRLVDLVTGTPGEASLTLGDARLAHADLLEAAKPFLHSPGLARSAMVERVLRAMDDSAADRVGGRG